jgi:cytidylate kinase
VTSKRELIIAIDGPSGVGKGTVARRVASALGYRHVDTGAMYRAVAWLAIRRGLSFDDHQAVSQAATGATIEVDAVSVRIDGEDVTRAIRTPAIDRAASVVARLPQVRRALVERQRALAGEGGVVMEGRDIGTVVFPGADVKIYLDASREERARRRAADPAHVNGADASLAAVARELDARDEIDRTRQVSPLAPAPDAHVIDTTDLGIDEVVSRILAIVGRESAKGPGAGGQGSDRSA